MITKRASQLTTLTFWPSPPPLHIKSFRVALKTAWRDYFGCSCPACTKPMDFRNGDAKNSATIDHIIARALGGNDELFNLQIICQICNNEKSKGEYHQYKAQYDPRSN